LGETGRVGVRLAAAAVLRLELREGKQDGAVAFVVIIHSRAIDGEDEGLIWRQRRDIEFE